MGWNRKESITANHTVVKRIKKRMRRREEMVQGQEGNEKVKVDLFDELRLLHSRELFHDTITRLLYSH